MAYVQTRLGRWFYEERGAPRRPSDPVLFLHHGLLYDGGMWAAQVPPLSDLGRVIVVDGPGHGKTEVPPPFSLEDQAGALADVFRALSIDRVVMIGHSWGGMLAMRAALLYPSQVAALALVDTSADAESLKRRVRYRLFVSFSRRFGLPPAMVERDIAPLMLGRRTRRERPELVASLARTVNGYPRDGTARAALAVVVHRKNILESISAIHAPTLILCGKDDRATPVACSEAIHARIAGSQMVLIEDSGHMAPFEQPKAVNAALVPFVRQQLGRG